MKNLCCALGFAAALFAGGVYGDDLKLSQVVPSDLVWATNAAGFEVAKVVGDPGKPGMYVNRVKFPANLRIQPHFHPDERVVVVLQGTVYFAYGEQFDEAKLRPLGPGSVWTEPARQPHYVWAKGGEAVIQVTGIGPSGTTQISK
jgi:quercetin dioxygenase-like cupin family protein